MDLYTRECNFGNFGNKCSETTTMFEKQEQMKHPPWEMLLGFHDCLVCTRNGSSHRRSMALASCHLRTQMFDETRHPKTRCSSFRNYRNHETSTKRGAQRDPLCVATSGFRRSMS